MSIDSKTNKLLVIVKHWIEMLQEQVSEDVSSVVVAVKRVLSNGELANVLTLVQVCIRRQFEDSVIYLEAHSA
jgi:hypothetical protein